MGPHCDSDRTAYPMDPSLGEVGACGCQGNRASNTKHCSKEAPPGKTTSWLQREKQGSVGGTIFSCKGSQGRTCMAWLSGCITHPLSLLTLARR